MFVQSLVTCSIDWRQNKMVKTFDSSSKVVVSALSHTKLESSRLGELKYAISAGYDVRLKNESLRKGKKWHFTIGVDSHWGVKRCERQLFLAALGQVVCRWKALDLGSLNMQFTQDWPKDEKITALLSFCTKFWKISVDWVFIKVL